MAIVLGSLLVVWGVIVIYSVLFRIDLKKESKEDLGGSYDFLIDIAMSPIFKIFSESVVKVFSVTFGLSLILLGVFLILF